MRKSKRPLFRWILGFLGIILASALVFACSAAIFLRPRTYELLSRAGDILSFEPAEVKALRKKEFAQEEEGHYEYYFSLLNKKQQRAYREMLESLRAWEEEFYLTISGDEDIDKIYRAVLNDHPELFWVRNRKAVYKTTFNGQDYCAFSPGYCYMGDGDLQKWESTEVQEILQSMQDAKADVAAMLSYEPSDYEIVNSVYNYVIDTAQYVESEDDQSLAGTFWKKEAVCAGYACAVQYLLESFGVRSIYVEGTSVKNGEGHAWNLAQIDGEWYYVDCTNGDQPDFLTGSAASLEEHKTILMDYLCPFPWEYEKDYTASDLFELPACKATAYNFYVLNQGCFDHFDAEEMEEYFRMRIQNGAAVVRFKFSNEEAFEKAREEWPQCQELENAIQYYMSYNGLEQVQYHYGLLGGLYTMYYIF